MQHGSKHVERIGSPGRLRPIGDERQATRPDPTRDLRQDDTPEGLAAVRYAWRDEEVGADVVLWTATNDTAQIIQAASDIEELAHKVSVAVWDLEPEDEAPPGGTR